jgi:hypothetical protein
MAMIFSVYAPPTTTIYLDPASYIFSTPSASLGHKFNVTVKVSDVDDLAAFEVKMYYDDCIINVTRWYEPKTDPDYVFYGKTTLPVPDPVNVDYRHVDPCNGSAHVGAALFPPPSPGTGFTGSGIICIFEFNITAVPPEGETYSCTLNINNVDTYLLDPIGEVIPSTKENGYYEFSREAPPPEPPTADFTWSPINPKENQTVTFDGSLSTPNGGSIINYTWDFGDESSLVTESDPITTHNYTKAGTYTITLNITDSEGLWDIESKPIIVLPPVETDVNGDCRVDWLDIWEVFPAFGSHPDEPRWNPAADVDYDERISMKDIYYIILDFSRI